MSLTRIGASIEGGGKIAGKLAHAEGLGTSAAGQYAHAEGSNTNASADSAHAEGTGCAASGSYAHAEGSNTNATGGGAHAEGASTNASGNSSHAEGSGTTASGYASHSQGLYATASRYGQSAQGSIAPSALSASVAQFSIYTLGAAVGATNGSTAELTFDGNAATVTGTTTNVLVIPLKSIIQVSYDFVMRPSNTAAATPAGCSLSGSLVCGRGNTTATQSYWSGSTGSQNGGNLTIPVTYAFSDTAHTGTTLQLSMNGADSSNNYLKFLLTNSTSGIAWSITGVVRCVELFTNV